VETTVLLKTVLVPIHRDGWPFIGVFAAIALGLAFVAQPLGWLGLALAVWCTYFFRNPDRVTPSRPGLVVSPADGVVQLVDRASPPAELGMGDAPRNRVAVFMNVFNVHVNRIPCDGTVTAASYRPGKFVNASLDKASEFNERQSLRIGLADGRDLACVQIAGLIARRIRCDVGDGTPVRTGQRFGLIRFGSRLDIYLPEGAAPLVVLGQRTIAGETVIADLNSDEPARAGEVR
jgi:phosphatidylserine decarboxylase